MHSNRIAYRLHNLLRCICPHPHAFLSPIFHPCLDVFSPFSIAFVFPHPGTFSTRENDEISLFVLAKNLKSTIMFDLYSFRSIEYHANKSFLFAHFEEFDRTSKRSTQNEWSSRTNHLNYDFLSGLNFRKSDCIYANSTTSVTSGICVARRF